MAEALCTKNIGRLLALDLGTKRIGLAVSDEQNICVRPLPAILRSNWKRLLTDVSAKIRGFDARGLVVGLPLRLDGAEGEAAAEARRIACNFAKSLVVPVYLQDERLSTQAAEERLSLLGYDRNQRQQRVDSESAAIILRDFLALSEHQRRSVTP